MAGKVLHYRITGAFPVYRVINGYGRLEVYILSSDVSFHKEQQHTSDGVGRNTSSVHSYGETCLRIA
jgi:hypothetical protein